MRITWIFLPNSIRILSNQSIWCDLVLLLFAKFVMLAVDFFVKWKDEVKHAMLRRWIVTICLYEKYVIWVNFAAHSRKPSTEKKMTQMEYSIKRVREKKLGNENLVRWKNLIEIEARAKHLLNAFSLSALSFFIGLNAKSRSRHRFVSSLIRCF